MFLPHILTSQVRCFENEFFLLNYLSLQLDNKKHHGHTLTGILLIIAQWKMKHYLSNIYDLSNDMLYRLLWADNVFGRDIILRCYFYTHPLLSMFYCVIPITYVVKRLVAYLFSIWFWVLTLPSRLSFSCLERSAAVPSAGWTLNQMDIRSRLFGTHHCNAYSSSCSS